MVRGEASREAIRGAVAVAYSAAAEDVVVFDTFAELDGRPISDLEPIRVERIIHPRGFVTALSVYQPDEWNGAPSHDVEFAKPLAAALGQDVLADAGPDDAAGMALVTPSGEVLSAHTEEDDDGNIFLIEEPVSSQPAP